MARSWQVEKKRKADSQSKDSENHRKTKRARTEIEWLELLETDESEKFPDMILYKSVLVRGRVVTVGDHVLLIDATCFEMNQERKNLGAQELPHPRARIDALYENETGDRVMVITWYYTGLDMQNLGVTKRELTKHDIRDDDFVLSTHIQDEYPISAISTMSTNLDDFRVHDHLIFDAETLKIVFKDDLSPVHADQEEKAAKTFASSTENPRNSFVDCLAAAPNVQHLTTFWRSAEDRLLRQLKDRGPPENKQRQILQDAKYEFEFTPLAAKRTSKCFCCGMQKICAYKVLSSLDLGGLSTKFIGSECYKHMITIRDFYRLMKEYTNEFQGAAGKIEPSLLNSWFQKVQKMF
jgi:hypothetical protein